MRTKSKTLVFLFAIYAVYVCTQFLFPGELSEALSINLPFSQSYFPSVSGFAFTYLLPLMLGYFLSAMTDRSSVKSFVYYINLSLLAGFFYFIPYLLVSGYFESGMFSALTAAYAGLLFPFLFLLGTLPNIPSHSFKGSADGTWNIFTQLRLPRVEFLMATLVGLVSFAINLLPYASSQFLIGSDIYYHSAMTNEILNGNGITSSGYFYEGSNFYYSVVYYIVAFFAKFGGISVQTLWVVYPAVCAAIFYFFFYLFSRKLTGNTFYAVLAWLFVLPTRQLTWGDPSVRNASYVFFAIFLYFFQEYLIKKKIRYLVISLMSFLLVVTSHPEIAIHTVGILFVYAVIAHTNILEWVKKLYTTAKVLIEGGREDENANAAPRNSNHSVKGSYLGGLDSSGTFVIFIFLQVLLVLSTIIRIVGRFPIDQILIFNDIPLSLFNPIGIVSFIVFMTFPIGLFKLYSSKYRSHIFLLAISSLGLSVIFFFTHLWVFYHRYFVETAYLAFVIFSIFVLREIFGTMNDRFKAGLIGLLAILVLVSFYPKYVFQRLYVARTNESLKSQIGHLLLIKESTAKNDVIVANPENILNRYIPFYSERYVFSGKFRVTKERQWGILSICNGSPYAGDCDRRNELSEALFEAPSRQKLEEIKSAYKADYLLLNKQLGEPARFRETDIQLSVPTAENDGYALYKL